jgi:hypothetical protein
MNNDIEIDLDTIDQLNEAFGGVSYQRDLNDFAQTPRREHNRRRKTWLIVAATATAAALTTGGIAAARRGLPDAVSYGKDVRSTEQAAALVDDDVTLDEYKAGFQRFAECMQRDSRPLADVTFVQPTQMYSYTYDGVDDCYDREFYAVDLAWQVSESRPREPLEQDISTAQIQEACATDGATPPGGMSQGQFEGLCDFFETASTSP